MISTAIDFSARYRVAGMPGVAFWLKGWSQVSVPVLAVDVDEATDEEITYETGEFEYEDSDRFVIGVMVGDDREHVIDIDDLETLGDLDYCESCGQIGCQHDGRERSE